LEYEQRKAKFFVIGQIDLRCIPVSSLLAAQFLCEPVLKNGFVLVKNQQNMQRRLSSATHSQLRA
jgi:hypothetical protein